MLERWHESFRLHIAHAHVYSSRSRSRHLVLPRPHRPNERAPASPSNGRRATTLRRKLRRIAVSLAPCEGLGFWFGFALRRVALLCGVFVQLHLALFPAGKPFLPSLSVNIFTRVAIFTETGLRR
jgi:hypothetical protein